MIVIQKCIFVDYMWLHIRGVGQWTNRLYDYFEQEQEKLHNGEIEPLLGNSGEKNVVPNGSIDFSKQNPIKKLQSSIRRSLSKKDLIRKPNGIQLLSFTNEGEGEKKVNSSNIDGASCSKTGKI